MPQEEHIHIIAVGKNIHNTFPVAIDEFKMSRAIVIMEESILEKGDTADIEAERKKIRKSIKDLRAIADKTKKGFEQKLICSKTITLDNVRDAVMEIVCSHPTNSHYYFNISGGTKVLSNGLFLMSIWLEATAYHIDSNNNLQKLNVPKIHVEDIIKNQNFITILEALDNAQDNTLPRKSLLNIVKEKYRPIKENNKKKMNLTSSRLTKWLKSLESWDIIEMKNYDDNKKEKYVKLTSYGVFSLKFIKSTCK